MATKQKKIDHCILMLTHNRLRTTIQCLDFLFFSNIPNTLIYILDNGSSDGTVQYLHYLTETDEKERLRLLFSKENVGVLAGREQLYRQMKKDFARKHHKPSYAIFLDSDVFICHKDWLNRAIAYLSAHPNVAMVGEAGSFMASDWSSFVPAYKNPVDSVAGYCQVWKMAELDKVEFDHSFEKFWAEDSDMCFQTIALGNEVHAIPLGLIHSPSHSGFGASEKLRLQNMERLRMKWRGKNVIAAERDA